MPDSSKKSLVSKLFNANLILVYITFACAVVSYFVEPGAYERTKIGNLTVVIADSYHAVERTPVSLLDAFRAIPLGLSGAATMMFAVMIMGGVVEVYTRAGVVSAAIKSVLKASQRFSSQLIISVIMIMFAVIGGILGWSEQIIPFVPIIISLTIALGYDSLVGMAISGFACLVTFAVGPFNMYTVGTSHTIAELTMFSGWEIRLGILAVVTLASLLWILRYAAKVKADPSKSLMADIDTSALSIPIDDRAEMNGAKALSLLAMGACFAFTIYGMLNLSWGYNEMSAIFVMSAVITSVLNRLTPADVANAMVDGCKAAFPGALIIGLARSIQVVMGMGGLIDPLVHGLAGLMSSASAYMAAVSMFIANFFINALIPSGSGQAMAVMPIMIPLADMLHITRQTAVLAFQFGDGISNTLWFTNGTLLIYCSLAKVPLKKWYRFIWPLQVFFFLIQLCFLYYAVVSGYGA